jgi:carboxymethylenebutenolidase
MTAVVNTIGSRYHTARVSSIHRGLVNRRATLWVVIIAGCTRPLPPAAEVVPLRSGTANIQAVLCRPPGSGPWPGLVVIHGDRGLTEWDRQQAQRLAHHGYVTLAVDLYRGQRADDQLEAHILDRGLPEERVAGDLKSAIDFLSQHRDVRTSALGVVGWDAGGGYALDTALRDRRLKACVVCYGRLTTDATQLTALGGPVLGLFAGRDEGIDAATLAQFQKAMAKAGRRVELHVYPNSSHGFLDPATADGPAPPADADDAWAKIESFLDRELH